MKKFLLSILALAASIAVTASNGALSGGFSINENYDRVQFSKGNLQCKPSTHEWRLAEHQYDFLGESNGNITDNYGDWIDLFGWGTGNNPSNTSCKYSDYTVFNEWGKNIISNASGDWRTLTGDEWEFLISKRKNAENLIALGKVDGVNGLILLPDKWVLPEGLSFTPATSTEYWYFIPGEYYYSDKGDDFTKNHYTVTEWLKMEEAGAVFLPAAGDRFDANGNYNATKPITHYAGAGKWGEYWASSLGTNNGPQQYAHYLRFTNYYIERSEQPVWSGNSVRLVQTYDGPLPLDKFTVTFKDWDGTILKEEVVQIGQAAIAPKEPVRDGYAFTSWNADFSTILNDLTVTARYLKKAGFSINDNGDQIQFSKGNLQYQASTKTWRFAENQWNYVGKPSDVDKPMGNVYENGVPSDNTQISDSYTGWIDLFGWGTGANPTNASSSPSNYTKFVDWGVNAISNGGNIPNAWRTLSAEEWDYLLFKRPNAAELCSFIPGGLVLLPDDWVLPEGIDFKSMNELYFSVIGESWYSGSLTDETCSSRYNSLSGEEWTKMEEAGAILLPRTEDRTGTKVSISYFYDEGHYWSSNSDYAVETNLTFLCGDPNRLWDSKGQEASPEQGYAVRLVQPYEGAAAQTCGDNLIWKFNKDSTILTIKGTGDMTDYEGGKAPWYKAKYKIRQVVLPEGITSIGEYAFKDCAEIQNPIILPEGVTKIGESAFEGCWQIPFLTIGSNVTAIGDDAFYECSGLKQIICKNTTPPTISSWGAFYAVNTAVPIYVPTEEAVEAYKAATGWKHFTNFLCDKDKADAADVIAKIEAIGEVAYSDKCKELIDAAREAYDALSDGAKAIIPSLKYKVLTDAEAKYAELKKAADDKKASDFAITVINAIGNVEYTDLCKGHIDAAREVYDALSEEAKALIPAETYKVLTDAEAKYGELKKAAEDKVATDAVIAKIDAIGEVAYTDESKALIDAARKAYDALTDDQKALVTAEQYKVLTDAEAKYEELKKKTEDDKDAVDAVIAKIDAIGEVAYTDESKAHIDAARKAYDALTDDQKALVTAEQYKVLTDAEAKYEELKKAAEEFIALTPQNLQVAKEDKDGDVLITLSWDKVNGAISYELRVSANGNELFSQNTMTLNVISRQLSALEKEYKLTPGTYTIDWSVRSTDALGIPMSDWAEGESFEVTVKDPATGVDEIVNRKSSNRKLIIDGVLYIEHNGKILDATGRLVK